MRKKDRNRGGGEGQEERARGAEERKSSALGVVGLSAVESLSLSPLSLSRPLKALSTTHLSNKSTQLLVHL